MARQQRGTIICDRQLIYRSEAGDITNVSIVIEQPVYHDGGFRCSLRIFGMGRKLDFSTDGDALDHPDQAFVMTLAGGDSLQALTLALEALERCLRPHIAHIAQFGRFGYTGLPLVVNAFSAHDAESQQRLLAIIEREMETYWDRQPPAADEST